MSLKLRNYQLPGTKSAYIFSDAAGANASIAMFAFNEHTHPGSQLFTNRSNFARRFDSIIQKTEPDLEKYDFDCAFLGTSHPDSSDYFELNCLKEARQKAIYTISFIDHWVNFKTRFTDANGETVFPNEIWVVDEKAKQLAIAEGLPSNLLKVTGNPYHRYLKEQWTPSWQGKSYLSSLNIKPDVFHIVFAPDPLSLRNAKEKTGFDEAEALRDLLEVISGFNSEKIWLLVKPHPLQPEGVLEREIAKANCRNASFLKNADTLELIHASDLVIGFFSNFLLDSKALGKKVLRYFPGNDEADLLSHERSLLKIKDKRSLYNHLKNIIYG
jgi:hypothetical protein